MNKEKIKEFILKTLLPYKENPKLCAIVGNQCSYLTKDGRKCAVGRWMKEGEWQKYESSVLGLPLDKHKKDTENEKITINDVLIEEAAIMNFNINQWKFIQKYHDNLARYSIGTHLNRDVEYIEKEFEIELPELKINKL